MVHHKKFLTILALLLFIALIGLVTNVESLAIRSSDRLTATLPVSSSSCADQPDDLNGTCELNAGSGTSTGAGTASKTVPKTVNAGEIENPLGFDSLEGFLGHISGFLFQISIPIVTIMIIWGGFLWMTAGANPERVTKGRQTITYAIIGFVIVLMAQGIVAIVRDLLSGGGS